MLRRRPDIEARWGKIYQLHNLLDMYRTCQLDIKHAKNLVATYEKCGITTGVFFDRVQASITDCLFLMNKTAVKYNKIRRTIRLLPGFQNLPASLPVE